MIRRAQAYAAVRRSEAIERNEAYGAFSAACTGEPPVVDHESAILHDLDAGFGKDFCRRIVAYPELKPHR
jgi:hypothetical protein